MTETVDPIADMLSVDDEAQRGKALPEAELNTEAPADKPEIERDETGKFKGKGDEAKPKEEKQETKPEAEKPKETVPLAKYLEEKNTLKKQLEANDLTLQQYRKELDELKAKLPKPEAPAVPDFVEDPKGYVDHKQQELLQQIAKANEKAETEGKKAQETAAQAAEQVQLQQLIGSLQAAESAFVRESPDYYDALNHVRNVRVFQLKEFNPEITDDEVAKVIRSEELGLAAQLMRAGKNPSQVVYRLAQQYGYQKKVEAPKLPEATNKRLPPDQTLGSGSAANLDDADTYAERDPFDVALASIRPKRA
jgi:hypothetical protein